MIRNSEIPLKNTPDSEMPSPLRIDDEDRYSRLRLIGWWEQERIAAARVLVVGAGALGCEVLKNLTMLGFGEINVIDFDTVQPSNLSRSVLFREAHAGKDKATVAAKMARELNPDPTIIPIVGSVLTDVGLGMVADMDLVICCVDNREARLWINRMCWKTETPWIDGGIQEINGVAKVFVPPHGSCYECVMTENDYRLIALRYSCPLLKQEDIQMGKVPTSPTIASMIGGLQVQEALKLLHDLPTAESSALVFNGVANKFYQTKYPRREDCLSHEIYESPVDLNRSPANTTVRQLFGDLAVARNELPDSIEHYRLILDRDFLLSLVCRQCDSEKPVHRLMSNVSSAEGVCTDCSQPLVPNAAHEIDGNSALLDKSLSWLGIPDRDILKVRCGDDLVFAHLVGAAQ